MKATLVCLFALIIPFSAVSAATGQGPEGILAKTNGNTATILSKDIAEELFRKIGCIHEDSLVKESLTEENILNTSDDITRKMCIGLLEKYVIPAYLNPKTADKAVRIKELVKIPMTLKTYTTLLRYEPFGERFPEEMPLDCFYYLDIISMFLSYLPFFKEDRERLKALFNPGTITYKDTAFENEVEKFYLGIMFANTKRGKFLEWFILTVNAFERLKDIPKLNTRIEEFLKEYENLKPLYHDFPRFVSSSMKLIAENPHSNSTKQIVAEGARKYYKLILSDKFKEGIKRSVEPKHAEKFTAKVDEFEESFFSTASKVSDILSGFMKLSFFGVEVDPFGSAIESKALAEYTGLIQKMSKLELDALINLEKVFAGIDPAYIPKYLTDVMREYTKAYFQSNPSARSRIIGSAAKALLKGAALGRRYDDPNFKDDVGLAGLEQFGTAILKLLQMAGDKSDNPRMRRLLSVFKSNVKRMSKADLLNQKIDAFRFGVKFDDYFKEFDEKPVGAGTIGQGHFATLKNETKVFVKVKRYGVEDNINKDLALLKRIFEKQKVDLQGFAEEFHATMIAETKFELEASNTILSQQIYEKNEFPNIKVGKIIDAIPKSKPTFIVMEIAPGTTMDRFLANPKITPVELETASNLMRQVSQLWLEESLFGSRYFHADLHAGNMLIEYDKDFPENSYVTLIDFGNFGQLPEATVKQIALLQAGLFLGNVDLVMAGLGVTDETYSMSAKIREQFTTGFIQARDSKSRQKLYDKIMNDHLGLKKPPFFVQYIRGLLEVTNTMNEINEKYKHLVPDLGLYKFQDAFWTVMRKRRKEASLLFGKVALTVSKTYGLSQIRYCLGLMHNVACYFVNFDALFMDDSMIYGH